MNFVLEDVDVTFNQLATILKGRKVAAAKYKKDQLDNASIFKLMN